MLRFFVANVVLTLCDNYGLMILHCKIIKYQTTNSISVRQTLNSTDIMQHICYFHQHILYKRIRKCPLNALTVCCTQTLYHVHYHKSKRYHKLPIINTRDSSFLLLIPLTLRLLKTHFNNISQFCVQSAPSQLSFPLSFLIIEFKVLIKLFT